MNRKSTDNHVMNCSDTSDEECLQCGTTQSLSRPDSALLGAHQFQATAFTGRAVGSQLPSSSKVSDNDVTNNVVFSHQSFDNDSECIVQRISENGTTQSPSRPDSALQGAHQFQATASTGRAVGSFSVFSSRHTDEFMPHSNSKISCDEDDTEVYCNPKNSHKVSAAGLQFLENESIENGTTQSLSRPDSALLGAHQFQATAFTGRAVGSLSDSLSSHSDQTNLCNNPCSQKTSLSDQLLSHVTKVKIILKNQNLPEVSLLHEDAVHPNTISVNPNVSPTIAGVSADQSDLSNDNDKNEFSSAASLLIESNSWNPNHITTSRTIPRNHRPIRPSRSCTKKKVIYDESSLSESSGVCPSRDSKTHHKISKPSKRSIKYNIANNNIPIDLCSDDSLPEIAENCVTADVEDDAMSLPLPKAPSRKVKAIVNSRSTSCSLLVDTDDESASQCRSTGDSQNLTSYYTASEIQNFLSSDSDDESISIPCLKIPPTKPKSNDTARAIENIVINHYERLHHNTSGRKVFTVKWSTHLCSLALTMQPKCFGEYNVFKLHYS